MFRSRSRNLKRLSTAAQIGVVLASLLFVSLLGCASSKMAELRSVPKSPLAERFALRSKQGPTASNRTTQFLRVHGLSEKFHDNPRRLLDQVKAIVVANPTPDEIYAFAELSFLAAKKVEIEDPQLATDLYGSTVLRAYQYLFDERFQQQWNPYDPHFRGACDLYNGALEAGLRLVSREKGLIPGETYTLTTDEGDWNIRCVLRGGKWHTEDFGHFEFVSDYEIKGLKNQYQTYGLGVPLIGVRRGHEGEPAAARYYPPDLSFPVTAFLRPLPDQPDQAGCSGRHFGMLELYDPLVTTHTTVGPLKVPLESDLSTPLAFFLSNPAMCKANSLSTLGLLRPDALLELQPNRPASMTGLYMVQPYEPDKIPVVMVHGLWSSPMTWMEMFNDLRSSPEIRDRYQFWFYLYPTAQPFWVSASWMRADLAEVRQVLDPHRQESALDQMVLIGHSMGGLVSRLQSLESHNDFWNVVANEPFDRVKAEPEVLKELRSTFYFHPNPSVRRVITVSTPHRGSSFSNSATRWVSGKLIRLPKMLVQSHQALFRDNKHLLRENSVLKIETSIDSLAPDSPFFPAMLGARRAPWVKYHNIIGLVPEEGLTGWLAAGSDGLVGYESARMEDVESELTIPADHTTVQTHPLAVMEIRRVLLKHLEELRQFPSPLPAHVRSPTMASSREWNPVLNR